MHKQLLLIVSISCTTLFSTPQQKMPLFIMTKKNNADTDKEDVKRILQSFAEIMRYFFVVVQNPENRDNITLGLAGMFANIWQASRVIMRGSDILLEEDKQQLEAWLTSLKLPIPTKMYTIVTRKHS